MHVRRLLLPLFLSLTAAFSLGAQQSRLMKGETIALVAAGEAVAGVPRLRPRGAWQWTGKALVGEGVGNRITAPFRIAGSKDFRLTWRLRMVNQRHAATALHLDDVVLGFEGKVGRVFCRGRDHRLRLFGLSQHLWERDEWIDVEVTRRATHLSFQVNGKLLTEFQHSAPIKQVSLDPMRARVEIVSWTMRGDLAPFRPPRFSERDLDVPWLTVTADHHPEILSPGTPGTAWVGACVAADGQAIVARVADDTIVVSRGGEVVATFPRNWGALVRLHPDPRDNKRIGLFVGPGAKPRAESRDEGRSWTGLPSDDSRFENASAHRFPINWIAAWLPRGEDESRAQAWCEPTSRREISAIEGRRPLMSSAIALDDERQLAFFDGPRSSGNNGWFAASQDGGQTFSAPRELPAILAGREHRAQLAPDGRLAVSFIAKHADHEGELMVWIGDPEDITEERPGGFSVQLAPGYGVHRNHAIGRDGRGWRFVWSGPDAETWGRNGLAKVSTLRVMDRTLEERRPRRTPRLPLIDLNAEPGVHTLVDREEGQYLGHVTTCLLEDGQTLLAVYPKGHGRGAIVYRRSTDGGRTWSERLPTPENWASSREVPTIHRVADATTQKDHLILWSGLHPARIARSEDEGMTWSPLAPVGNWGGIVVMSSVIRLANGDDLAFFHDDGRFLHRESRVEAPPRFRVLTSRSRDAGRSWSRPRSILEDQRLQPCEPGCLRSPDGRQLAVLLRENARRRNSQIIFSKDEGATWSTPRELPADLTGDRHVAKFAPDGRLVITFRDMALESPTRGDWLVWVGRFEDLERGTPGAYRVRIKDNHHGWDSTYAGLELLPDGTFVTTTYGTWTKGAPPYILSARFTLADLDRRLQKPR